MPVRRQCTPRHAPRSEKREERERAGVTQRSEGWGGSAPANSEACLCSSAASQPAARALSAAPAPAAPQLVCKPTTRSLQPLPRFALKPMRTKSAQSARAGTGGQGWPGSTISCSWQALRIVHHEQSVATQAPPSSMQHCPREQLRAAANVCHFPRCTHYRVLGGSCGGSSAAWDWAAPWS